MSRPSIILTGLVGLVGAVFLTALCLFIMAEGWLPVLVTDTVYRWGIFLFLAAFSVAEIPIMIFGLGRLATSANPRAKYVVLLANAGYPFFGAVYAAPFILLTGQLALGTAMAALSFVRFATAVIFLAR